jgi:hypothetical protein
MRVTVPFEPRNFFDAALLLTVRVDTHYNGQDCTGAGFLFQLISDGG